MREDNSGMMRSSDFKCSACGGNETKWAYLSSVRDVGKSETWGSKSKPELLVRVVCEQCGNSWNQEKTLTFDG